MFILCLGSLWRVVSYFDIDFELKIVFRPVSRISLFSALSQYLSNNKDVHLLPVTTFKMVLALYAVSIVIIIVYFLCIVAH